MRCAFRLSACLLSLLLVCVSIVRAQVFTGAGTYWDDSFREWVIYTDSEGYEGKLELRWKIGDNWAEWDFRIGDTTATIERKWEDDPNLWEVHCLGTTVTMRTLWPNDFRQWRLHDGQHSLTFQSRYSNVLEEWMLRDNRTGDFRVFTYYEGDPRDWVIEDSLSEDVTLAMRLALIFIAIYHSTPKV